MNQLYTMIIVSVLTAVATNKTTPDLMITGSGCQKFFNDGYGFAIAATVN